MITKKENIMNKFAGFLIAILTIGLIGCGSVPDRGYKPFTSEGYHPFGEDQKHGEYLTQGIVSFEECTECHGADLKGVDNGYVEEGEKDRSCLKCHGDHSMLGFNNAMQHGTYLAENGWDLSECYICHSNTGTLTGVDFGGSCRNAVCHAASAVGPQACNTCHGNRLGDPSVRSNWAPPQDLEGNTSADIASIGAHQVHLTMHGRNSKRLDCQACHNEPAAWDDPGHINGTVDVAFHFPATAKNHNASYNADNATCSAVYCHGGQTASWLATGEWTSCTACHGMPPGGTHYNWPGIEHQCHWCHGAVVSEIDGEEVITSPEFHVDGFVTMN